MKLKNLKELKPCRKFVLLHNIRNLRVEKPRGSKKQILPNTIKPNICPYQNHERCGNEFKI
jgi:hypothetical protein